MERKIKIKSFESNCIKSGLLSLESEASTQLNAGLRRRPH